MREYWSSVRRAALNAALLALNLFFWNHGDHFWWTLLAIVAGVPTVALCIYQCLVAWSERGYNL